MRQVNTPFSPHLEVCDVVGLTWEAAWRIRWCYKQHGSSVVMVLPLFVAFNEGLKRVASLFCQGIQSCEVGVIVGIIFMFLALQMLQ